MKELLENSDSEHPLKMDHILAMLSRNDIRGERKSVYDDIKVLRSYGLDIENRRSKPSGYYIASRDFELAELKLLVDSVQASKFITHRKSTELIKKLEKLTSHFEARQLQRQVFVANRIKTMNESIYQSIDKIHSAISAGVKVRFQYFEWTVSKEIALKKEGEFYQISPWGLVWEDENYYMIGYDGDARIVKHYRVDKMLKLESTDQRREGKEVFEKFDTANYTIKTFGMFGGKEETVQLLCENRMAGVIIDRFGKEIMMHEVKPGFFRAIVNVHVSPQFFGWILGLGDAIRIQAPKKTAEQFCQYLDSIQALYQILKQ